TCAVTADEARDEPCGNEIVHAAIDERRRQLRGFLAQYDCSPPQQVAWERAATAHYDQRAGDHAAARIGAGVAFHHDDAAAPAGAAALPAPAAHRPRAAAHAGDFARPRPAQAISGAAKNLERAPFHARCGPWTHAAVDHQAPASHQAPDPGADIALHHDLAVCHFVADPVEAVA